jgi:hypothetical protein
MRGNGIQRLALSLLLAVGTTACAVKPTVDSTARANQCPAELSRNVGDSTTCHWVGRAGSKKLVCNFGSQRVTVDTSGVGEG